MVIIKGHEIGTIIVKNAHNRRALQLKNNIVTLLRSIGINENDIESNLVLSEKKTFDDFISEFREDSDVDDKRKEARAFFGFDNDLKDFEIITKKYKAMAKELHPDMPSGDNEKFKQLNIAHKILKRELT